ncbi:unnamed protein product [Sphagnum tenellum]
MKSTILLTLIFLSTLNAQNCNQLIIDTAGVLTSVGKEQITQASQPLIAKGAEVHIVTSPMPQSGDWTQEVNKIDVGCGWRTATSNDLKSTMILIYVAPNAHKTIISSGSAWKRALDNPTLNRIQVEYTNPRFRDGNYSGGVVAGENQIARRIDAAQDETIKGTTIINQATDLKGFYQFLDWTLGLLSLALIIWGIATLLKRRATHLAELADAQQRAIFTKNKAASLYMEVDQKVNEYVALEKPQSEKVQSIFDQVSSTFGRLGQSIKNDPNIDGLTLAAYNTIKEEYNNVIDSSNYVIKLMIELNYDKSSNPSYSDSEHINKVLEKFVPVSEPVPASFSSNTTKVRPSEATGAYPPDCGYFRPPTTIINNYTTPDNSFIQAIELEEVLNERDRRNESYQTAPSPAPVIEQTDTDWNSPVESKNTSTETIWSDNSTTFNSSSDFVSSSDFGQSDSGSSSSSDW